MKFDEGTALPVELGVQARLLFSRSYHRYHYLHEIGSVERVHFVAAVGGRLVGYATFRTAGDFAHCANLLVDPEYRGLGIGRQLEQARRLEVRRRGKSMYVSCMCNDSASQKLKSEMGLTPVCVKYGFRREVLSAADIGSAVVFSEGPFAIHSPHESALTVSTQPGRVQITLAAGPISRDEIRGLCDKFSTHYVALLAGRPLFPDLRAQSQLAYGGIDLDEESGRWHFCFQLMNKNYEEALLRAPRIAVDLAALERFVD